MILKFTPSVSLWKMGNKFMSSKHFRAERIPISSLPYKVCVVGSGNWGSVISKIVGENVQRKPETFSSEVTMYVYEEFIDGVKLTDIINTLHENVKYLPGCLIPENVVAVADIVEATAEADILVFVLPHQFIPHICRQIAGKIKKSAIAVSLVKGLKVTDIRLELISSVIRKSLGLPCAVLMGANIANEVATENFCEATIGCRDKALGRILKSLFQTPYFRINVVPDEETVELCGALKNVIAVGAGFLDGLQYGDNTKVAAIRLGLMEMIGFSKHFFPDTRIETFLESCGIADLVTTCYSGRECKVAEAYASGSGKTLEELELEMLNGQKLQGPPTAADIHSVFKKMGRQGKQLMTRFPILVTVHRVCSGEVRPESFIDCLKNHPAHV